MGPNPLRENSPDYIEKALKLGFDVEIDVWHRNGQFYLGHDKPQYKVESSFLKNRNFWCHAKNLEALDEMLKKKIHCFWHQNDEYTLTSKGIVWAFPGKMTSSQSICVMPENFNYTPLKENYVGVCSDFIEKIRKGI